MQNLHKWSYLFDLRIQTQVMVLMETLEAKDEGATYRHSLSVAHLAGLCADAMDLPAAVIEETICVGLLHDVGKADIEAAVLLKPAALTDEEAAHMRLHPVLGEKALQHLPGLVAVSRAVRAHHERWDGGGYPDRLAATQIPLSARIVSVADAFDAMTSDRPYRRGMSTGRALAELERCSGSMFDPAIVRVFCSLFRQTVRVEGQMPVTTGWHEANRLAAVS